MATCRLCLSKSEEFVTVTHHNELPLRIEHCVSVKIDKFDNLPKTVCAMCVQRIDDWFEFKEMCINSNEKLKLQMKNDKVENVKQENEFIIWAYSDSEDVAYECEDEELIVECHDSQIKLECLQNTYNCEMCPKEFDAILEYLDHQDEHNGQPVFNCDKCYEIFTTRSNLVEHEKKHKSACPHCGKMILKSSLQTHLIQHTDRYVCTDCSHRFGSKATLEQHVITVHTDRKDHICESCGKRFSSKTSMNVHLKTHIKERAYTCKLCSYAGRTSSALYIHMATHANEVHCCKMCPKVFKSSRNLTDHLRRAHSTEKKHQCANCNKKFVDKYMMLVHLRTHTGVRPYKCKLCDKAFIRSDSLKEHTATHGLRIFYDCSRCMKKFTSKRGYARHSCNISVA